MAQKNRKVPMSLSLIALSHESKVAKNFYGAKICDAVTLADLSLSIIISTTLSYKLYIECKKALSILRHQPWLGPNGSLRATWLSAS